MAEGSQFDLPISPAVRGTMASLRKRYDLNDDQVANALISWFASLDPDDQQRILDSAEAQRATQDLVEVRRVDH